MQAITQIISAPLRLILTFYAQPLLLCCKTLSYNTFTSLTSRDFQVSFEASYHKRVQTSKLLYMYECCSHNLLSIHPSWLVISWRIRVYIESLHFGSSHSWIENHEIHPVGWRKLRQYTHLIWNPIDSKSKETDLMIETLIGLSIFKSI